jgi:hypothetical protein
MLNNDIIFDENNKSDNKKKEILNKDTFLNFKYFENEICNKNTFNTVAVKIF